MASSDGHDLKLLLLLRRRDPDLEVPEIAGWQNRFHRGHVALYEGRETRCDTADCPTSADAVRNCRRSTGLSVI
jgi:hypothetical protein